MKRYRVLRIDFDARANILATKVRPDWEQSVREGWERNQEHVRSGLRAQFGDLHSPQKETDFCALGAAPFSVVGYHNVFLRQARQAFIAGGYYAALTAAGCLAERILNQLVLGLRDDFQGTPEYKKVYGKQSFQDWSFVLGVLESWGVLVPAAVDAFKALHPLRNAGVHFEAGLTAHLRQRALEAVRLVSEAVSHQFGAFGTHRWFIPNEMGISFLTAASVSEPFIRTFYLPSCELVGPRHDLAEAEGGGFRAVDDYAYPNDELTDAQFLEAFRHARRPPG